MSAAEPAVPDVRRMVAGDAPGLAALLGRCYGATYPKRSLYDPTATAAAIAAGDYGGVVAVADDAVVGHIGFSRPSPAATVVEAGTTIVDVPYRGAGLMNRMALALGAEVLAGDAAGFVHLPTTAHTVMQRASVIGGRETGILLAYVPRSTRDEVLGAEAVGRVAVTVVYQPLRPAPPQPLHVPERYRERIAEIAAELSLERPIAERAEPAGAASRIDVAVDDARSLTRVSVRRGGASVADDLAQIARRAATQLVHVDLAMDDPSIEVAAEALRAEGFAYAAWLPGWDGHDVLRMQRVAGLTEAELAPSLYSPEAQALCAAIRAELRGDAWPLAG